MVNLVIDTNTWIYMANGYNQETEKYDDGYHFKLVGDLINLIEKGQIRIIVNQVIIDEWNRNKEKTENLIKKHLGTIEGVHGTIKGIKKKISKESGLKADEVFEEYKKEVEKEIEKNRTHILEVEDLIFNKSINIPIKNEIKITAADLALQKKAPFHNKNNSVGDAVILLSAVDYFQEAEYDWIDNTIFVSNNSDDYCEKKGSKNIHPDLVPYFRQASIQFEINIAKALNLSQNIVKEIYEFFDYVESINPCLADCKGMEYGMAKVFYHEEVVVPIEGKEIEYYNPNQLQFDFPNIKKATPEDYIRIQNTNTVTFKKGSCDFCGALHLRCDCGMDFYSYGSEMKIQCTCGKFIEANEDEIKVYDE